MKVISHKDARSLLRNFDHLNLSQQKILNLHLSKCEECSEYSQLINHLNKELKYDWVEPVLTTTIKSQVIGRLENEKRHNKGISFWNILKYTGLASASLALLIGFLFTFIRLIPTNALLQKESYTEKSVGHYSSTTGFAILAEQDLNCDDRAERLVIYQDSVPEISGSPIITRVGLEATIEDTIKLLWSKDWDGQTSEIMLNPQILRYDQCTSFITIPTHNLTSGQNRLAIYRISGDDVKLVLYTEGLLKNSTISDMVSESGLCEVKLKTYRWEDNTLHKVDEKYTKIPCNQK